MSSHSFEGLDFSKQQYTNVASKNEFEFEKYVLMPNSPHNYIIRKTGDKQFKEPRWNLIISSLSKLKREIHTLILNSTYTENLEDNSSLFQLVQTCILSYNASFANQGNFAILQDVLKLQTDFENADTITTWETEIRNNLPQIIISIIDSALELPSVIEQHIELLKAETNCEISLSQKQIHCLLSNAFFCTFPKRNGQFQYQSYPRINFFELYDDTSNKGMSWRTGARSAKVEKLKCFINYFYRMAQVSENLDAEIPLMVNYARRTLSKSSLLEWETCTIPLSTMIAKDCGTVESAVGTLQVDFANKFVGGGTLGNGSAMEEIRFSTCPELVVAQLFTESLSDLDTLRIRGFKQYSNYTGYGSTFKFLDSFEDTVINGHEVVVLDALQFQRGSYADQFEDYNLNRELYKCLIGFLPLKDEVSSQISSGKWGCGVFNGNPELKSLIQWIAASACDKSLDLYTFGDMFLTNDLNDLFICLQRQTVTIGMLYQSICKFREIVLEQPQCDQNLSLFDFIKAELGVNAENIDNQLSFAISQNTTSNIFQDSTNTQLSKSSSEYTNSFQSLGEPSNANTFEITVRNEMPNNVENSKSRESNSTNSFKLAFWGVLRYLVRLFPLSPLFGITNYISAWFNSKSKDLAIKDPEIDKRTNNAGEFSSDEDDEN